MLFSSIEFHPIKNFRNCAVKILRRFFANFCHEIGCENDQTLYFASLNIYLQTLIQRWYMVGMVGRTSQLACQRSPDVGPTWATQPLGWYGWPNVGTTYDFWWWKCQLRRSTNHTDHVPTLDQRLVADWVVSGEKNIPRYQKQVSVTFTYRHK
jgi:hypothetical protein